MSRSTHEILISAARLRWLALGFSYESIIVVAAHFLMRQYVFTGDIVWAFVVCLLVLFCGAGTLHGAFTAPRPLSVNIGKEEVVVAMLLNLAAFLTVLLAATVICLLSTVYGVKPEWHVLNS